MDEIDKRPTAYSYVRMSSQQQIKGDSLRRQLDLSRAYAAENNLILDETLKDIGVSAWTGANVRDGDLGRFFELVQTGRIARGSYLLVESFDRLSRQQVRKSIGPFIDLINAGITVVTLGDKQVYSESSVDDNFAQLILSLAIMSRAHEESQTKSKRLKAAHENRRKKAAAGQGRFSPQIWGWIDQVEVKPNTYEYRENQHADTIRKIYEYADMGLGQIVITRRLNEAGVPGFMGKVRGWQQATISKILMNEAVIGTYQPTHTVDGKRVPYGDAIPDFLPKVISDELYWRVQRNKKQRLSKGKKGYRLTNIIGPISSCRACQSSMRVKTGGFHKNPLKYIRCDANYRGGTCNGDGGQFRYDIVENTILDHVNEFHLDTSFNDASVDTRRADLTAAIIENERKLAGLEKQRELIRQTIGFTENEQDRRDLVGDMNKVRSESEETKGLLTEQRSELILLDSNAREVSEVNERIQAERLKWPTATDEEVYESRSKVSQALVRFIDLISFDSNAREFTVIISGGLRAYKFDKKGRLIKKFDAHEFGFMRGPNGWTPELLIRDLGDDGKQEIRKMVIDTIVTQRGLDQETQRARMKAKRKAAIVENPKQDSPEVQARIAERRAARDARKKA